MKKIFTCIITLLVINSAYAELEWSKSDGWQMKVKSGALSHYMGDELDGNAIELMNKAKAAQESGNKNQYSKAINSYNVVIKKYPKSEFAPEALYQKGVLLTEQHRYSDAFESFEGVVTDYPEYPKFNKVIGAQFHVASHLMEGKRPHYWGVIPGFRSYKDAHNYFERVVKNAPNSEYAPMALMNMGMLAEKNNKKPDAIDAFKQLIEDYPQSILAPDAHLKLAQTYQSSVKGAEYDQNSTLHSINYYNQFLLLYQDNPQVEKAEQGLKKMEETLAESKLSQGDFYYNKRNNPEAAIIYYNQAISIAPKSRIAELAKLQLDKVHRNVEPPKTIADHVFGRYDKKKGY